MRTATNIPISNVKCSIVMEQPRNNTIITSDGREIRLSKTKKYHYLDHINTNGTVIYRICYPKIYKKFSKFSYASTWNTLCRYADKYYEDDKLSREDKVCKLLIENQVKDIICDSDEHIGDKINVDERGKNNIFEIKRLLKQHVNNSYILIDNGIDPKIANTLLVDKDFTKFKECPYLIPTITLSDCIKILRAFNGCRNNQLIRCYKIIGAFIRYLHVGNNVVNKIGKSEVNVLCTDENGKNFEIVNNIPKEGFVVIDVTNNHYYNELISMIKRLTGSKSIKSLYNLSDPSCINKHNIELISCDFEQYEDTYTYLILEKDHNDRRDIVNKLYEIYHNRYNCYEECASDNLYSEQMEALERIRSNPLSFCLGIAGSGKTRVIQTIAEDKCKQFILTPTGAAALRATYGAQTAHRYYYGSLSSGGSYPDNINNLIFDEISMIDVKIFAKVLRITPGLKSLHCFGDDKQLPPVGAGHLIYEIFESGVLNDRIIKLKENHRADNDLNDVQSSIIKDGEFKRYPKLTYNKRHIRIEPEEVVETYEKICQTSSDWTKYVVTACRNECDGHDKKKECVRCVRGLNNVLKEIYRKNIKDLGSFSKGRSGEICGNIATLDLEYRYGDICYGDIIRYEKNKYGQDIEIYQLDGTYKESEHDFINGQRALFLGIDIIDKKPYVRIQLANTIGNVDKGSKNIRYRHYEDIKFSLGFASTIHKVQGEEFETIMCCFNGYYITRELVYTALSRGRKQIYSWDYNNGLNEKARHPLDILRLMLRDKFKHPKTINSIKCSHIAEIVENDKLLKEGGITKDVIEIPTSKIIDKTITPINRTNIPKED